MCVCVYVCSEHLLVSQLMSHSEGQWEACVLANAAATMWLTHAGYVGQTQSLTWRVDSCADVFPVKSGVLVSHGLEEKQETSDTLEVT